MARIRKPLQGVTNILRFNWHFYVIALLLLFALNVYGSFLPASQQTFIVYASFLVALPILISLLVSWYIYDLSNLYELSWISAANGVNSVVNIHAGFDETSALLKEKLHPQKFTVLDFYDPEKHTEISIKRARKAYPAFPGTQVVTSTHLGLPDRSADMICVIFSAHEIRNATERAAFFKELTRILSPGGTLFVTEHLRDVPNFAAYNFGFFHFHSRSSWLRLFPQAGLALRQELKVTPFISTFILQKHGAAS